MKKSTRHKLTLKQETLHRLIGGIPEYTPGIQPASQNSIPLWQCLCDNTGAAPVLAGAPKK